MDIISTSNSKVKNWMKYQQKKYRDKDACFLVEGRHLIQEALHNKCVHQLLIRKGNENPFEFGDEVYFVSDEVMNKLSKNVSKVDYLAVCRKIDIKNEDATKILLLDDVQDPGNLGTMIRSALSFGFDQIYVSKGCVDVYNEKVIRSTQGALFYIPIIQAELNELILNLQSEGFKVYATALHNAKGLQNYNNVEKVALVFGNEGSGVKEEIIAQCDDSIYIEMFAFESLNVAVAAGICMYHFKKNSN